MAFSQSSIVSVSPPRQRLDGLHLSWTSTSPAGTWFQAYLDRKLSWSGQRRYCVLPAPTSDVRIDVGTVGPGESTTDFSASLPAAPSRRAALAWTGGAFLDPSGAGDVAGFRVFGAATSGGAIDYSAPLGRVPAYVGTATTGWNMGGYGAGGWGSAAGSYSWESGSLPSGSWPFAVAAYDSAGNLGPTATATVVLSVPPRCPGAGEAAPRASAVLLGYGAAGYGSGGYGQPIASLTWLPSPG